MIVNCATGEVTFSPEELNPPPIVPGFITRRQCALELLNRKMISPQEALDMTKTAALPVAVKAVLDKELSGDNRILAEIDFAAANYYRENQLLGLLGMTSEQIDEFFISAGKR